VNVRSVTVAYDALCAAYGKLRHEDGNGPWEQDGLRQCQGAASFRANVGKLPRDRDIAVGPKDTKIFAHAGEFLEHHNTGWLSIKKGANE